jgi:hypothetical protein
MAAVASKMSVEFGPESRRVLHSIDRSLQALAKNSALQPALDVKLTVSQSVAETLRAVRVTLMERVNTDEADGIIRDLQNIGILPREAV